MRLIDRAVEILARSNYDISKTLDRDDFFLFENDSVLGLFWSFKSLDLLNKNWQQHNDNFLERNAAKLQLAGIKLWNMYSVFATSETPADHTRKRLNEIEEDLRGTRKLAMAGVVTHDDTIQLLLPLLPLQSRVTLQESDMRKDLLQRLDLEESLKEALSGDSSAQSFADATLREALGS